MTARAQSGAQIFSPRLMAMTQLLGSIVSLQFGSSIAKTLFPVFGAIGLVSLRIGIAAALLLVIQRPFRSFTRKALMAAAPYGVSMALMNVFFYLAIARLPIGVVVPLEFTGPLLMTLVQSRRVRDFLWLALTVIGLVLLLRPHGHTGTSDVVGLAEAAISSIFWVAYILCGKYLTARVEPQQAAALGLSVGAIAMLPVLIPTLMAGVQHPHALGASVFVAMLSSALPYTLELMAMRSLSSRDLGVLYSMEPVGAVCAGFFLLGEVLSLEKVIGVLCVVAASAGVVLLNDRKVTIEAPPL